MEGYTESQPAKSVGVAAIDDAFQERENYLIIGLTGLKGAGCTEVCKYLTTSFQRLALGGGSAIDPLTRDDAIVERYARHHWIPFDRILVPDIMLTFALQEWNEFCRYVNNSDFEKGVFEELPDAMKKKMAEIEIESGYKEDDLSFGARRDREFMDIIRGYAAMDARVLFRNLQALNSLMIEAWQDGKTIKEERTYKEIFVYAHVLLPAFGAAVRSYTQRIMTRATYTVLFQKLGNLLRFRGKIGGDAFGRGGVPLALDADEEGVEHAHFFDIARRINCVIKAYRHPCGQYSADSVRVVIDSLKNIYEGIYLRNRYSAFYLFSISSERSVREDNLLNERETWRSLDPQDIRNIDFNERPSEAKGKFREFRSMIDELGGSGEDEPYLSNVKRVLDFFDSRRASSASHDEVAKVISSIQEEGQGYAKAIFGLSNGLRLSEREIGSCIQALRDEVQVYSLLNGLYQFYLQDVESCIQDADVFLTNNEKGGSKDALKRSLLRYVCLILRPGIVLPTAVERCMQIAYSAKMNSGCISRQVGAVVTDAEYNIMSIGWNDVPCGQTPCSQRNIIDLWNMHDEGAFSDYEFDADGPFRREFLNKLDFTDKKAIGDMLRGLPASYCFKDAYCEHVLLSRDKVFTRAMHAEERALIACDKGSVRDGILFTTSYPCELCSKSAKEHRVRTIYYIEPYAGISRDHITECGEKSNRAEFRLFQGAIGRAYMQLFSPMMPYKNELELRGFPDSFKKSVI